MALRLFNSLSMKKEALRTMTPGMVRMYVCGVTPYDTTHLGHAFTYVSYDVLARYLRWNGFSVSYTQNVTDIDDDILDKAKEVKEDWRALGDFWTRRFLTDMRSLNVAPPDNYVKATDTIPRMVGMISVLLKKGMAYRSGSNVYFNVKKFPRYGGLSRFNDKQMRILQKERGEDPDDPKKRDPLDFLLWKGRSRGEPHWKAPWGDGRPGWHIECSAMINQYLGDSIDVHGGGRDLVFPHHESEIAQSESFTGKSPFARCFMHTAMVMYMGEKMAKSLGNLVLVADLLKVHSPNAIRWMLISHHYRDVWDYTPEDFREADKYAAMIRHLHADGVNSIRESGKRLAGDFRAAMDDDLDTPAALDLIKKRIDGKMDPGTVKALLGVLGFIV